MFYSLSVFFFSMYNYSPTADSVVRRGMMFGWITLTVSLYTTKLCYVWTLHVLGLNWTSWRDGSLLSLSRLSVSTRLSPCCRGRRSRNRDGNGNTWNEKTAKPWVCWRSGEWLESRQLSSFPLYAIYVLNVTVFNFLLTFLSGIVSNRIYVLPWIL